MESSKVAQRYINKIENQCRNVAVSDESLDGEIQRRRAEQIWRVSLCLHLVQHGNASLMNPLGLREAVAARKIVLFSTIATT